MASFRFNIRLSLLTALAGLTASGACSVALAQGEAKGDVKVEETKTTETKTTETTTRAPLPGANNTAPAPAAAATATQTNAAATPATTATAAQTKPVDPKVLPLIREGYTYLGKNDNVKAVKVLRKAVTMDPTCISGRRYLAYALIKQEDFKGALMELQKVSKLVPPNAFDFYLFGEAYYGANGMSQAHDCYSEALHQNGTYDAARVGLVRTYARENKFEDAFNVLQQGVSQAKDASVKKYYASLAKAVSEAKAYRDAGVAAPTVNNAPVETQIGSKAEKSAPVVLK